MKTIRQLHLYLGLFFAPSIIFFAFTGTMQTFSLHENKHPGDHNPEWIATLASVHKDQVLPVKKQPSKAKEQSPAAVEQSSSAKQPADRVAKKEMSREKDVGEGAEHDADAKPSPVAKSEASGQTAKSGAGAPQPQRKSPLPLKTFVGFLGIGLICSSLLGIYMAFKYNRDRRIIWGLLIAGMALPLLLLFY